MQPDQNTERVDLTPHIVAIRALIIRAEDFHDRGGYGDDGLGDTWQSDTLEAMVRNAKYGLEMVEKYLTLKEEHATTTHD